MKQLRIFGIATALVAVTAVPVRADINWSNLSACGGNAFSTCASVTLDFVTGDSFVTVSVRNLPEAWATDWTDVIKAVGLINLPSADDLLDGDDGITYIGGLAAGSDWKYSSSLSGPLPDEVWGAKPTSKPNEFGILETTPYTTGVFQFNFKTGVLSNAYLATVGIGVHAGSGPNGCSTKMGVLYNGDGTTSVVDNYDLAHAISEGCVSVPEPASSALLVTGLMGLAVIVRRRRGAELLDESGDDIEI